MPNLKNCLLSCSQEQPKDKKRSSSQASNGNENKAPQSRSNSRQSAEQEAEEQEPAAKAHKYVVEARVLKDSWPLSPAHWEFVNRLKEAESAELKVFAREEMTKERGKRELPRGI